MNPEEPIQPSQPVGVLPPRAEGAEIEVGPDDIEVMIDSILDNVLSQFDANVEPLLELLVEEENEPDQVKERLVNQSAYLLSVASVHCAKYQSFKIIFVFQKDGEDNGSSYVDRISGVKVKDADTPPSSLSNASGSAAGFVNTLTPSTQFTVLFSPRVLSST